MADGYCVSEAALATRVGELNAVADEVANVIGVLGAQGCDLGPGDISAAVGEVMQQWSDNLGDMRDKIGDTAENVNKALSNYQVLEDDGENRMRALANQQVVDDQMNVLRGAAVVTLAQEQAAQRGGK
jgi:2-keto-3-deoxy-L-rhamnonate aldolase RhmA